MTVIPKSVRQRLKQYGWLFAFYKGMERKLHHLKDWWGTKVWKQTTEVTTPLGFKLISGFHPAYQQMRTGEFEMDETKIIKKMLASVQVFVDVGANLGYYTCLASQQGRPVLAFEPQQQNLKCLMQNLTVNGYQDTVEIFPLALSAMPGLLTLYGASGPSASLIKGWAGYSSRYSQQIPVSTLDIILGSRFEKDRIFIKIDVEGAEYQVLSGAHVTLDRKMKPIWLLEVCLEEFHPTGFNPDYQKIFDLFFDRGYLVYTATEPPTRVSRQSISNWVEQKSNRRSTFNYVFIDESIAPQLTNGSSNLEASAT
jgi:FkbM family methyltransferase